MIASQYRNVTLKNRDCLTCPDRLQARIDSGELVYFTDQVNHFQNYTLDSGYVGIKDDKRETKNGKLLSFLKDKYGEESVMRSPFVCDPDGRVMHMPGLLGVYVSGIAIEMVNFLATLPVIESGQQN